MTDELKPCPFCGCDVELIREDMMPKSPDDEIIMFAVFCKNCGCSIYHRFGSPDFVIRSWNTRHEPDQLPQWAIDAINKKIKKCRSEQDKYNRVGPCLEREFWYNRIEALKWVLALHKPEEK